MGNESRERRPIQTALMTLAILAALLAPLALAAAQSASKAELQTDVMIPAHVFHGMGFHRIPEIILTPATLAAMGFWMWVQLWEIGSKAWAGRHDRIMQQKGQHFTIACIWLTSGAMLLNQHDVNAPLEITAEVLAALAAVGVMWRFLVARTDRKDPKSSIIGYMAPARNALRQVGIIRSTKDGT